MTFVPSLVGGLAAGNDAHRVVAFSGALSLVFAVVLTGVVLGVGAVTNRASLAKRARGQVYRLHLLDRALLFSSSLGDALLVPYDAVVWVDRRLDHVLVLTTDRVLVDVPVAAFGFGALDVLLGAIGPRPPRP
jgi:hypothetical protein